MPAVVATSALPSYAASMGCLGVSFSSTATDCPDIGNNGNTQGSTLSFRVTNGCGTGVETTSDVVLTLTVSAAQGSQSPLNSAHFSAPTAVVGTISATASPATWTWTIPSGTILAAEAALTGSMVFGNH